MRNKVRQRVEKYFGRGFWATLTPEAKTEYHKMGGHQIWILSKKKELPDLSKAREENKPTAPYEVEPIEGKEDTRKNKPVSYDPKAPVVIPETPKLPVMKHGEKKGFFKKLLGI